MRAPMLISALLALLVAPGCATYATEPPEQAAAESEVVDIWPGEMPGRAPSATPERREIVDHGWRTVTVLGNVTEPSVTVIRPAPGRGSGAAMIVLPGGGFAGLAWDLEGLEVGNYLAERGITAFVLKYRVHQPTPEQFATWQAEPTADRLMEILVENRNEAAADALQAVRYVRANAARYGLDPNRVGMMGFSAGAITTLRVLHDADDQSRPNIAAPIYGFMHEEGAPAHAPPIFVAHARNDVTVPFSESEAIAATWRAAGAPVELHIFETGEHGFALGHPGTESQSFAGLFETWLREQDFIRSGN